MEPAYPLGPRFAGVPGRGWRGGVPRPPRPPFGGGGWGTSWNGHPVPPALSTRVDKTRLGRDGPSLPSIDRVTAAARDVDHAAQRLAEARDGLGAAIRDALATGYSLRTIAGAAWTVP